MAKIPNGTIYFYTFTIGVFLGECREKVSQSSQLSIMQVKCQVEIHIKSISKNLECIGLLEIFACP